MNRQFKVHGFREIEATLKQFPLEIQKRALDSALRKGVQPILEEARLTAPWGQEETGRVRLRRSKKGAVSIDNYGKLRLELRVVKISDKLTAYASKMAVSVGKAFWGMFQEFGTRTMPNPPHKGWLRRAFDAKAGEALKRFRDEMAIGIKRAAKRLAPKAARSAGLNRRRKS